jgi:glycosyltransferase involved in cell wall biosynthesis
MVVRHDFSGGPFAVTSDDRVRVLPEKAWGRAVAEAEYDFVYVIGAGLDHRRWVPRLRDVRGVRVVLDLDRKRKFLEVTDVLHCEAPRAEPLPRPHVVATPDPRPTIPDVEPPTPGDFYLTAFTPYGSIKGHEHVPAFCEHADRRLVWCFDLTSWGGRRRKLERACRRHLDEARHPRLELVEAPSQEELYRLYRASAGYVCFSREESLGFAMLDAVALGKPLCARRIGVCRALDGFRATEDFTSPVFGTYALPAMLGYGALFERVPQALEESAS